MGPCLRVTQAPHEKSIIHEHPASVAHQKITDANGKTRDFKKKAHDVAYFDALNQAEENVADQPPSIEAIIVELKPGAPKAIGWPVKLDPNNWSTSWWDGNNIGYIQIAAPGTVSLSQTLAATLLDNTSYTLRLNCGAEGLARVIRRVDRVRCVGPLVSNASSNVSRKVR